MYVIFVFILIVIIGIILFRKNNILSLQQAKQLNETANSHYFEFAKQHFHYVEEGEGEVVLLIHGIGDSFYVFEDLAKELSKSHRVLRIDLPGFGLSEIPNFNEIDDNIIQYFRDFLEAFLNFKDIDNFHLVGNSLGGLVAWDWAVNNTNFTLKSLCLIASAGFEMEKVRRNVSKGILDKLPNWMLKKGAPKFVSKIAANTCINDKSKIDSQLVQAHHNMINKEGTIPFFLDLLYNPFQPEISKLENFKVPTLIVWGDKDKIIPVDHSHLFQNQILTSKVLIYKGVGHYPHIENIETFLKDYLSFIK